MNTEGQKMQLAGNFVKWQEVAKPRFRLKISASERKPMLVLVDMLLINGAVLAAVTIWNDFDLTPFAVLAHAKWFVTLSIVWFVVGRILDVYDLARAASTTTIIASAGMASLLTGIAYLLIPWLTPPILTRSYAYGFLLIISVSIITWRMLYAQVFVQPAFHQRMLILGTGDQARKLYHSLSRASQADDANPFRGTGYQVLGLIEDDPSIHLSEEDDPVVMGNIEQLVRLARMHRADGIIVALTDHELQQRNVYDALLDCKETGLQLSSYASIYEQLTSRLPVEYAQYDPQLILSHTDGPGIRLYQSAKRWIDIAIALCGVFLMALAAPWVALCNALTSPGPLFYRQQRVGKGGKPFAILKFRSMQPDAEACTGAVWCRDADGRVTPVGRWLRRLRVDELPQFLNVLRNEMSVIGPRPERPFFIGLLSAQLPLYRARHAVKPGITGWAQVNCSYGDSIEGGRVKLEYDLYYVKHAGFYLDLVIMLKTLAVILGFQGR